MVNEHGTQVILLLLPLIPLVLVLVKVIRPLYIRALRRRVLYWYRRIKSLDRSIDDSISKKELDDKAGEIEVIEAALRKVRLPLDFADHLDDLREYIRFVRERLGKKRTSGKIAFN
jgi:hypothetical protein